jgi:Fe-S-cluster containining protein
MKEFPCTKCGACCKLVPDSALQFFQLPRAKNGGCGHLNDDNSCAIYDTRPDICNVQKSWKQIHSKYITWDEYIELSLNACKVLEKELEKKKVG